LSRQREGVVLLLEDENGRIAMQFRDDLLCWGLFGGWIDEGESPEDTAIRELSEELNIKLPIERFEYKAAHHLLQINATAHVFHVAITNELDNAVLNEGLDWQFMSRMELLDQQVVPHHLMLLQHYYG
jgi:8-oxo-dGTP pyrophosphatase MutT (NUDIX family)